MRVTKYTHSCLRIDSGDSVLVVDPGAFSERAALTGADAVLITHEHFDHLDVDALADALASRPELRVFAHADVLPKLTAFSDVVTAVAPGDEFSAAGFTVTAAALSLVKPPCFFSQGWAARVAASTERALRFMTFS